MEENTIDLRELWQIIDSHKVTIGKITAACMVCAGLYLIIVPPTYESTSLLRIKQEKGLGDSILDKLPAGDATKTKQQMDTDAEILKSRSVVIPVIQATEKPDKDGIYPDYDGYVKGHITTLPFKDTEILQVSVTGKTPVMAKTADELLVQGFLKRLTDLSHDEQKETREFIQNRMTSAKQELTGAEDKLQQYQVANKIYSPDDQMKGLTDKLSMVDKQKADNQLNLETAQAALSSVNGQLGSAGQSIADSPAIQEYKKQLVQLEVTKAGYTGKYTDSHPKMQEVNSQIADVQSALDQEISRVVSLQAPSTNTVQTGLMTAKFQNEAAIAVAEAKEKALAFLDKENDAAIAALPQKEQGFIQAKREADVSQEIYVMLAKRLEEAKIAEVMVPHEVQVVDSATLPEHPVKPKKGLTMLLSLVLGLLAGCGFVTARELLNRKIRTSEDVDQYLQLPILGMIPDTKTMDDDEKEEETDSIWIRLRRKLWRK